MIIRNSITLRNQLKQLERKDPRVAARIIAKISPNHQGDAIKLVSDALKRMYDKLAIPYHSDICKNCNQDWRRCGCQEMRKLADLPDSVSDGTASEVLGHQDGPVYKVPGPGNQILEMLPDQEPPPVALPPVTEAQKKAALDALLRSQQPKSRIGTIPVAWGG